MGRIVIASQMKMQDCSFSTGAFAPSTAPENLLKREPSDALILTDPANLYIEVGLAQAEDIRLVMPICCSLSMAAQWRVRAAASQAALSAAPQYDSGWMAFAAGEAGPAHRRFYRHDWLWSATALTHQWWRIDFDDAALPNGRLVIGGLLIDGAWQPGRNYSYDAVEPYLFDPSRAPRADAGQRPPLYQRPYDRAEFTLQFLSRTDAKRDLRALSEHAGTRKPVAVIFDPDEVDYRQGMSIFGLLTDTPQPRIPFFENYSSTFGIEELLP